VRPRRPGGLLWGLGAVFALGLLLVGSVVTYGFVAGDGWGVSASTVANADGEDVAAVVENMAGWRDWVLLGLIDPTDASYVVGDPALGESLTWVAGGAAGSVVVTGVQASSVSFTLVRSGRPPEAVYEGETPQATGRFESQGRVSWEKHPEGVAITWTDAGELGVRPVGPFMVPSVTRSVTEDLRLGLEALVTVVERRAAVRRRLEAASRPAPAPPQP